MILKRATGAAVVVGVAIVVVASACKAPPEVSVRAGAVTPTPVSRLVPLLEVAGRVAVEGSTAVLADEGAAYVFVRTGATWALQQKLVASDGGPGDGFGAWTALSGDTVVVGAPDSTPAGQKSAGAAYVFTRTGTTWAQQQKLVASDLAAGRRFGASVTISGDTAVVLSPAEPADGGGRSTPSCEPRAAGASNRSWSGPRARRRTAR